MDNIILDNCTIETKDGRVLLSLPHGSGINGDYDLYIPKNNKNAYISNAYHVMDDNGHYIGYVHFNLIIPVVDLLVGDLDTINDNFKVTIDSRDYRLSNRYMIKDYLIDTYSYYILYGQ